ncbi:MAG TPA: CotH kinase family protein, partial [Marmoricola sp.]|nr:CotH kinase family protein [Marmoricola sp.]
MTDNPRPGRLASLQIESNGQWRTISTPKPMTASGSANWTLTELPPFSATYRVLLQEWQASPARASSSVSFQAGTGLPLLELSTVNEQPVVDKVNYVPGEIRVAGTHRVSMRIKGRGNSTWTRPKKPYRLKLDSSTGLLNMPADRDWVLLANYLDRSYLRNWAALKLASQSRLKWTPRSEFVEVTLNGVDLGNYLLTEQVEQGPHKLALPAGSLLLEIDQRFQEQGEPGFVSSHQVPITYKDPDELSPQMEQDLEEAVAGLEKRIEIPTL